VRASIIAAVVAVALCALTATVTAGGPSTALSRVTGRQIADGTVTGRDVRNGSLTAADLAGLSGLAYRLVGFDVAADSWHTSRVFCQGETKVLGGGVSTVNNPANVRIAVSAPLNEGAGWTVTVFNDGSFAVSEYIWAVCAAVAA